MHRAQLCDLINPAHNNKCLQHDQTRRSLSHVAVHSQDTHTDISIYIYLSIHTEAVGVIAGQC